MYGGIMRPTDTVAEFQYANFQMLYGHHAEWADRG